MKLAIIVDPSFTQTNLSQVNFDFFTQDVNVCVLPNMPEGEFAQKLTDQGFRFVYLSDLICQSMLNKLPSFSEVTSREEITINHEELATFYRLTTIFVTGGEGFIGSKIVDNLLQLPVSKVIVYGHGENSAYELYKKYGQDRRFEFVLGDVRDIQKLNQTMQQYRPSIVFHAAAHKHVPVLDSYPEEAIKTNIMGTVNTINAAEQSGVKHFVLVSTDKAVNPISALGTSKRIAEKICLAMDGLSPNMRIITTRFGNVFGSIGSVVPIFLQQIADQHSVTITDPLMQRYFMSVNEAAWLVLLATMTDEGNLFAFDMGEPISIGDLAQRLVEYVGLSFDQQNIQIIGNRGGEKITEELIYSFEHILHSKYQKLFILNNTQEVWDKNQLQEVYSSLLNIIECGSRDEILGLLQKYTP